MKKKIISITLSAVILLVSVAITMRLIANKPTPPKNENQQALIAVNTTVVKNTKISSSFNHQGRVNSVENVSLSAEVSGKILNCDVPLKEGQSFQKGDVLIKIFDKDAKANMNASKSSFLKTLSKILPDLKIDFSDRYAAWLTFFNAIEIDKPLPALPNIQSEKEKIFLASNNILTEYYSLHQQEINLSKYSITAPFNGFFKKVNKEVGAIAANGSELAVIIRSDLMEIEIPVPVQKVSRIKKGNKVSFQVRDENLEGNVNRISGFVDAETQSVKVFVQVKLSAANQLMEGEFVSVQFSDDQEALGVEIPREAVLDGSTVFVVESGELKKVPVTILIKNDDTSIIAGIDDGAELVMEALVNVNEGTKVRTF